MASSPLSYIRSKSNHPICEDANPATASYKPRCTSTQAIAIQGYRSAQTIELINSAHTNWTHAGPSKESLIPPTSADQLASGNENTPRRWLKTMLHTQFTNHSTHPHPTMHELFLSLLLPLLPRRLFFHKTALHQRIPPRGIDNAKPIRPQQDTPIPPRHHNHHIPNIHQLH